MAWRETAAELTEEFMAWGCRYSRKQLPGIAMGYDCSPLQFWNWMDGEAEKSEKGFLRVLGYAWRKCLEEEGGAAPLRAGAPAKEPAAAGKRIAA